ncbi:unnamed protein product, partial [Ectocarpus sp. 8 AP-2014]
SASPSPRSCSRRAVPTAAPTRGRLSDRSSSFGRGRPFCRVPGPEPPPGSATRARTTAANPAAPSPHARRLSRFRPPPAMPKPTSSSTSLLIRHDTAAAAAAAPTG